MSQTTAILSLLHESADRNSATRPFRHRPVLAWTLDRLARSNGINQTTILCWSDQLPAVTPLANHANAQILSKPRTPIPPLDQVSAAQRWTDGWRGGLLGACHFDRGFHAPYVQEATQHSGLSTQDLIFLIDPASALVDPHLLDALVTHATNHPDHELYFTQSAPGLAGVLLRPPLLDRLVKVQTHPGRLLSYWPDTPGLDPITCAMNMPVPAHISRTAHRFTLDSDRQLRRITTATASLNGELISSDADRLVALLDAKPRDDSHPREITLELTTRRATRPIFAPGTHLQLSRGDMPLDTLRTILAQLQGIDDLRLTLAGAGDPLLHPHLPEILNLIDQAQIPAVHLETDLVSLADSHLDSLAASRIDMLSLHIPAVTAQTYQQVMGIDALQLVIENLKKLLSRKTTLPLIIPTFTKCRANLGEMEAWYDHWLRALGLAVITGPSDHAGQIPDQSCADMSPPRRRPCARINTRLTILSDGTIPSCENDPLAQQPQGRADTITQTWQHRFPILRAEHESQPLCTTCKDWHRP